MRHPFEKIPPGRRRALFRILTAITVLQLGILGYFYLPLNNTVATQGMVSLELASTTDRLNAILASWSDGARSGMVLSLKLNFLCLLALTNTLALACVMAAGKTGGAAAATGVLLAWMQWIVAIIWAVQNSLLLSSVLGHATSSSVALSSSLAIAKFALTGAGLVYAVVVAIGSKRSGLRERPVSMSQ